MKLRLKHLWKVPVYCLVSSWISYYITIYLGGFFFTVETVTDTGAVAMTADPVRSAVFHGILFVAVLLLGGLWAFRSMTKAEIGVSAGIIIAAYLAVTVAQLCVPDFPLGISMILARFQNWTGTLASFLLKLTGHFEVSILLCDFAPLLFIPFGRKSAE